MGTSGDWDVDEYGGRGASQARLQSEYPILSGIMLLFRGLAVLTGLAAIGLIVVELGSNTVEFTVIVGTLIGGASTAALQLLIAELIAVFVDTAINTGDTAERLSAVRRDISALRTQVDNVVNEPTDQ